MGYDVAGHGEGKNYPLESKGHQMIDISIVFAGIRR
jgi:hypothetical protein